MLELYLNAGLAILGFVTGVWVLSLILKDSGIMDIFWGLGFILVTVVYYMYGSGNDDRMLLMLALVVLWGIRLAAHILVRNWGQDEDARYNNWRNEAGKAWWWKSYLKVFLLQGVVMWIVSLPLLAAHSQGGPLGLLDWIGTGVFAFGFLFESIADMHLLLFKKNPANKGKVLDTGLWSLSRHPNYFGEATLWWGFGLIALSTGAWWTLVSPLLMTWLLLKVSGVKMLDDLLSNTKPQYRDYIKRTPAFLPLGRKAA